MVAVWLILSITLGVVAVCVVAYSLFRDGFHLHLHIVAPQQAAADKAEAGQPIDVPREVLLYCAQESEQFAREAMLRRAVKLYEKCGNWDTVLRALQREEGD